MQLRVLVLVVLVGCYAPQRPGAARTTYLAFATTDGAFLGGVGAMLACEVGTRGFSHGGPSKAGKVCGLIGALVGGGGALYGSATSDDAPDKATWAAVSILPAMIGVGVVAGAIGWAIRTLSE